VTLRKLRCLIFDHAWVPIEEMPGTDDKAAAMIRRNGWIWFCRSCGSFHKRFSDKAVTK